MDIGADLIESPDQANATVVGYHGGPEMAITGRSADIRKPTKPNPIVVTNDRVTTTLGALTRLHHSHQQ